MNNTTAAILLFFCYIIFAVDGTSLSVSSTRSFNKQPGRNIHVKEIPDVRSNAPSLVRVKGNLYGMDNDFLGKGFHSVVKKAINVKDKNDVIAIKIISDPDTWANPIRRIDRMARNQISKLVRKSNPNSPLDEATILKKMDLLAGDPVRTVNGDIMIPIKYLDIDAIGKRSMFSAPKRYAQYQNLDVNTFLKVIERIHSKGYLHGDPHFGNLGMDRKTRKLVLFDFGLSSRIQANGFDKFGKSRYSDSFLFLYNTQCHETRKGRNTMENLLIKHFDEAKKNGIDPIIGVGKAVEKFFTNPKIKSRYEPFMLGNGEKTFIASSVGIGSFLITKAIGESLLQ